MSAEISEVRRLAQTAQNDSKDVRHKVELIERDQIHHEKVCAERYSSIDRQLGEVKSAQGKANEEQKASNKIIYETMHRLEVAMTAQTTAQNTAASTATSTTDHIVRWGCGLGGLIVGVIGLAYAFLK